MRSMGIDRRTLLRAAGLTAIGCLVGGQQTFAASGEQAFIAARQETAGGYAVAVFGADGIDRKVIPLPGRGHDVAVAPQPGLFVAFARRPGRFAVAVCGDAAPVCFEAPAGRHFYGHGCFSPAGDLLYATENDFARGQGVVGVYAVANWQRLGEFPTYGIGPHELLLLPDGETLAVANGGIATDPEVADGRTALDTAVTSDLVLIDRRSGTPRGQWRLPPALADLSIRHLALDRQGQVWFGCQWEGAHEATPPLIGCLTAARQIRLLETTAFAGNLANYVGSVASDRRGGLIAFSSPRAGAVVIADAAAGRLVGMVSLGDGCGLAADTEPGCFVATSGGGVIEWLGLDETKITAEPLRTSAVRWDNHLRPLTI